MILPSSRRTSASSTILWTLGERPVVSVSRTMKGRGGRVTMTSYSRFYLGSSDIVTLVFCYILWTVYALFIFCIIFSRLSIFRNGPTPNLREFCLEGG